MMRKKLCPQCKISSLYVKNEAGDILPIYVYEDSTIRPKNENASLEGYDLDRIFCLGCSWKGSVKGLI